MLYQVATALIAPEEVAQPIRAIVARQANLTATIGAATGLDLEKRQVRVEGMPPLTYDYLVIALGAQVNFFGTPGAEEHGFPLYTLPHAVRLKDHLLRMWEATDKEPTLVEDGALNVVVVGGGATGVESAGAIIELYRGSFVKDYPRLPATKARVIIVELASALLGAFKEDIQTYTKGALEKRGVEVRLDDGVTAVSPTRVTLKSGEVLRAHTLVWGAGLQASSLIRSLNVPLERGGRLPVRPDLSLEGHAEVFAVGDAGWITDSETKQVLPQLGSVALQSGECAGGNIALRLAGQETAPFRYVDKGMMATIGRGAGVAQLPRGKTLKGKLAWFAWGGVHLTLLSGGSGQRARILLDWGLAGLTRRRTARVSVDATEK
jgi:NADH dehydrogenase